MNAGHMLSRLAPREPPTVLDIAWAAGIIEGEGHINQVLRNGSRIVIRQSERNRWLLDRMCALFGGSIRPVRMVEGGVMKGLVKTYTRTPQYEWHVHGARAPWRRLRVRVPLPPPKVNAGSYRTPVCARSNFRQRGRRSSHRSRFEPRGYRAAVLGCPRGSPHMQVERCPRGGHHPAVSLAYEFGRRGFATANGRGGAPD